METFLCLECSGMFVSDDLIRYGDGYICGRCKPIFMQKLSEGALRTNKLAYAGFWRRFVAVLLDGVISTGICGDLVKPPAAGVARCWSGVGCLSIDQS